METHLIRADGSIFPAHLTVAPMIEAGKIVGVEVIFQDISQQKAAEARLYQLANFDSLTGCANRRHFMEQLSAYFDLGNEPMALLMLDLDHFKKINDTHGHAVGDAVLQAFSRVLHDKLHHDDVAGRIGGEEFTVLLPNSNAVQAKAWAEDMREAVAALVVTHSDQNVGVTVSVGVAEFDLSLETIDDWLLKADKAVYRAKDGGRNQVVVS
jgi:diguanylate cyclase (GGDEF)-like protein